MHNLIINGVYLPAGLATKHNKVIGKANNTLHIQEYNIRSLLITGYLNYLVSYVYRFQKLSLHTSRLKYYYTITIKG